MKKFKSGDIVYCHGRTAMFTEKSERVNSCFGHLDIGLIVRYYESHGVPGYFVLVSGREGDRFGWIYQNCIRKSIDYMDDKL